MRKAVVAALAVITMIFQASAAGSPEAEARRVEIYNYMLSLKKLHFATVGQYAGQIARDAEGDDAQALAELGEASEAICAAIENEIDTGEAPKERARENGLGLRLALDAAFVAAAAAVLVLLLKLVGAYGKKHRLI